MLHNSRLWIGIAVVSALVAVLSIGTATAIARNPNPGVLPPHSKPYGKSYGEWGAAWWQWALSIPLDQSPVADTTGEFCGVGQSGKVWFLAGSFGGSVERDCTVPAGNAIFFPIVNIINDYPCPDPSFQPAPGQTLEEFLTEGADFFISHVTELEAEVDGVALEDLFDYRATSKLFTFTGDPSLTEIDPCITGTPQFGVADGYWIMLAPLSAGSHAIHLRGKSVFPEFDDFVFETEVTYNLTVAPPDS